jgi:hypothetical protein
MYVKNVCIPHLSQVFRFHILYPQRDNELSRSSPFSFITGIWYWNTCVIQFIPLRV